MKMLFQSISLEVKIHCLAKVKNTCTAHARYYREEGRRDLHCNSLHTRDA